MTKQIRVNGVLVPAPETEAPTGRGKYCFANPRSMTLCSWWFWEDSRLDEHLLQAGLVYLRAEDATARAKAMLLWEPVNE